VTGGIRNSTPPIDVTRVRADFPILRTEIAGKPLVYLDNAATTQKPNAVLDTVQRYYEKANANVHRGIHTLSERATDAYEDARDKLRRFLNVRSPKELVFVRGTTEAINLVAQSFARPRVGPGDEILVTELEHHSNIVPWQLVREQTGCTLKVVPIDDRGELVVPELERLLGPRTRLLSLAHVSNALGTVNPVQSIVATAHACGVPVLIDGAQAVAHGPVDVQALDCDFYVFSGHKMFGPTGIGALFAKQDVLEEMPPYHGGGDMIRSVRFDETIYNDLPWRFEAGTPNIAGAIGLGAAVDYLDAIGMDRIAAYEQELLAYAVERVAAVGRIRLIGTARDRAAVVSFVCEGVHAHDVAQVLDGEGIAVRAGHHCAMPAMEHFGVAASVRASLAPYNTREEIDRLEAALIAAREMFA